MIVSIYQPLLSEQGQLVKLGQMDSFETLFAEVLEAREIATLLLSSSLRKS